VTGSDFDVTSKTYTPRPRDIERKWYVVDADGAVLGRLATEVAAILRGKHKPMFAPHMDTGDHVIVINAAGIRMTGVKADQKIYHRHSGYPGGLREQPYSRLMAERPTLVIEKAVRGMLPKTRLGRQMISKLAVYAGPEHPHEAQKPEALTPGQVPAWDGLAAPRPKPVFKAKAKARKAAASAATASARSTRASSSRSRSAGGRSAARGTTGAAKRGAGTAKRGAGAAKRPSGSGSAGSSAASRPSSGRSQASKGSKES
jgi:large subunit ribosomal protein L13